MKVADIIKSEKPSLSFEVFPPKTDAVFESIRQATEDVAALKPDYMSVTYGAGGGTSEHTVAMAKIMPVTARYKIGSTITRPKFWKAVLTLSISFSLLTNLGGLPLGQRRHPHACRRWMLMSASVYWIHDSWDVCN